MEYNFRDIEKKWQQWWSENKVYKVSNDSPKPKCYVLDMFPYPSGAGLHVGHPLGYIASDIYSRYKRLKGFNVLHPMGYDAFGLPAEQYAIEHGIHPAVSTAANIKNFRSQLDKIGFCYDWDREVNTSKPGYYKWTQWIFLQLFNSYFCHTEKKALPISKLIKKYEEKGAVPKTGEFIPGKHFTAEQWKAFSEKEKADVLMRRRLAYCGYGEVNWCEALGTVLANDEVVNGVSERGGHPVVKKTLRQWYLRITEYADRLLEGLDKVDFSDAMKEMQTNWIGKSTGAEIDFKLWGGASPLPSPGGEEISQDPVKEKFFRTADSGNWHILKKYGRENRKDPTEAEDILWQRLRNNQLGAKVRRQHAIQGYIADFVFLEVKLVIEVDGEYHNEEEQKIYDDARTKFLNEFGLQLLRFTNEEVISNTEKVINEIKSSIEQQRQKFKTTAADGELSPSPQGEGRGEAKLRVYTTRPDTIFGVDFMVIAPEHELVEEITTDEQKQAVDEYIAYVKSRSERERMAEKKISGVFTGAYALNPFNGREIPIWISEYVLAGYGTGAIMGVPCGDERDHRFAKHFNIPITNIIGEYYTGEDANPTYDAVLENSDFINGMKMKDAIDVVVRKVEEMGIGQRKVNYKMRDAAFSRQRYWGEPFPIVWKNEIAYPLSESELPVELPHMDDLKPGPDAQGPLANLTEWINLPSPSGEGLGVRREVNTMPGYAGSSWYFLRYMDPDNEKEFCSRKAADYWGQVDLYIGGTEHAVGHLLYSRMWTKFLFDLGLIEHDEPYKRLVNQGMIQGSSRFAYFLTVNYSSLNSESKSTRVFLSKKWVDIIESDNTQKFISEKISEVLGKKIALHHVDVSYGEKPIPTHVDVNIVDGVELDIEAFKRWRSGEYANAEFILEDGKYICGVETEKMSKSKFNTVNPDDLVMKYGADTFRMYEMFLGPVEMSKPWDTKGIEGVHRFLKKFWRLFFKESNSPSPQGEGRGEAFLVTNDEPTAEELKVLHNTIRKIESDTERFSFNTGVSAFMIATNELTDLKCHKRKILEPLLILLAPYAPHISEELYAQLRNSPSPPGEGGGEASILNASYPVFEDKYVKETTKAYPVAINGKTRSELTLSLDVTQEQVEQIVLQDPIVQKWLDGKTPKKIIYVKNKMINVVI
ncbi:MAG: leucine--tRNA ligase [Chitinophagaceae bacterium]|nr:leucine--tRNA ligase [Chitinophagaceae bacterium]